MSLRINPDKMEINVNTGIDVFQSLLIRIDKINDIEMREFLYKTLLGFILQNATHEQALNLLKSFNSLIDDKDISKLQLEEMYKDIIKLNDLLKDL